jgi:tripartite-type tricarboxylate transporter receptor subunit TctC
LEAPRVVVPFGRGGAADRAARALVQALARAGIATQAIENLPGGGGRAGVERANAFACEDAPVLLLGTPTTHTLLPECARVAPDEAFAPLVGLGSAPNVLLVSPRLGIASVEALVARARRERLAYASAGAGQTIHLCTALLCAQAGIAMDHRPCEAGSAAAYDELAAGRVQVYFDSFLGCLEHVARGDVVALAVSSRARHASMPAVPTLAESGFPAHALDVWLGAFGANVETARFAALVDDVLLRRELEALGLVGGPTSPARLLEEARQGEWARRLPQLRAFL